MSTTELNNEKETIIAAPKTKIYDSAEQDSAVQTVRENTAKAPQVEVKKAEVPKPVAAVSSAPQPSTQATASENVTPTPKVAESPQDTAIEAPAPVASAPVQSAAAPAKSIIDAAKANATAAPKDELPEQLIVMTIDDDKWIQRIFTQYIGQWGFRHIQASDPYKGLMDAIKYQPHLIFLDIVLPEVGGETVLQFLRNMEATKNIPVVIISGNLNKELIRDAYVLGAKGFITKPFNQEILFSKIKETLDPALYQKMVAAGRIIPNVPAKKPQVMKP